MAKNAGACGEHEMEIAKKTAASRIFDTARDLFYRRGVRAVGVDEIVCEAGVTKPSLYRAFKSKDDLVAACLQESAREGREAVHAAVEAAGSDPRARIMALVQHFSNKLHSPDFRGCLMSNIAVELAEPGHPGRAVVEACKADLRATLTGLSRDLGVDDPERLADGVVLIIEGAIATHHIFGRQGPALSMLSTCKALVDASCKQAVTAG